MDIMRTRSRLTSGAPPPSPIPTAKGSRSAATETFSQYVDNCLHIPELIALPSHLSSTGSHHSIPADVDLRSLSADSIARLLSSAKKLGAFRIIGHGISAEELRSLVLEAKSVFRNVDQPRSIIEEIAWVRDRKNKSDEKYRDFSENVESVASKVEEIGEQLREIFCNNKKVGFVRGSRKTDWVFGLYRYNHEQDSSMEQIQNTSPNNNCESECDDHGLCIHLSLEESQFYIPTERGPLSFDVGPEMLVVTVGKQLEGFKCVSGKMIVVSDISRSQASFSLQLKVPFSSNLRNHFKTVSITDQVFFAVFLCLLYQIVVFMYTYITTT